MRSCTLYVSSAALVLAAIFLLPSVSAQTCGSNDATICPKANGPSVVETTLSLVEASCVFEDDKLFMRRLAYVESSDGLDLETFRDGYYGGIWQVDSAMFDITKSASALNNLQKYITAIHSTFGIYWPSVTWEDLTKPLHSALGARLYLQYQSRANPTIPRDIPGQASFWKRYYRPSGDTATFIEKANRLQNGCKSSVGADIVFVLDGSGSIGSANFKNIKDFVKDVVDAFDVGSEKSQTQFGVIKYSSTVTREFDLNTYSTKLEVQQAVDRIQYVGGGTETDKALDELRINGFRIVNGARMDHPTVGIVLTDGVSNNPALTIAAAKKCQDSSITMFAIGAGTNLNMNELSAIASDPDCIHLTLLSLSEIDSLKYAIQKQSCAVGIIISGGGSQIELPIDGEQNCKLNIPDEGATIEVSTEGGESEFYVSKSTYPTSSFYDQMTTSGPGRLGVLYVSKPQNSADGLMYCNIKGDNNTAVNITIDPKPGDKSKCEGHTCLNGATCVGLPQPSGGRDYRCDCAPIYYGENCELGHCSQWQSYSHMQTQGGQYESGYVTLNDCLNVCANSPKCHAIDYGWEKDTCWLHLKPTIREEYFKTTQYVINRDCSNPPPPTCFQWTEIAGQQSRGGIQQPRFFTLSDCKETCQFDPRCVGLDYDRSGEARCWLHLNADNFLPINTWSSNNADQHRLQINC